jgi:hypothetical protein
MDWRLANGETWAWNVYEVLTGPDVGSFVVRSPNHSWADWDAYDAGFGPEGGMGYGAWVAPLTQSVAHRIEATDTTKVRLPDDMDAYNLFQVITWHLKPGSDGAFNEAVGKYHAAITEADYPMYYVFLNNVAGAEDGPAVVGVFLSENWAAFGEGDDGDLEALLLEKYGEEGLMEIGEQFQNSIEAISAQIVRIRRDLSIAPDM